MKRCWKRIAPWLLLCVAGAFAAPEKRAPGAKPKMVVRKSTDGRYSLRVPDDWVLAEDPEEGSLVSLRVTFPGGGAGRLRIADASVEGAAGSAPHEIRRWARGEANVKDIETGSDPVPYAVVEKDDTGWNVVLDAYLGLGGRTFRMRLECAAADRKEAVRDALRGFAAWTCELEPLPPVPDEYKTSRCGSFLVAAHPDVHDSIKPFARVIKDVEKSFCKFHGALPKRARPMVVFVHPDRKSARDLNPAYAEQRNDFEVYEAWHAVFGVPLDKFRDNPGHLAREVGRLCYLARYGSTEPHWAYWGEGIVARAEIDTGKPLPSLSSGMAQWGYNYQLWALEDVAIGKVREEDSWRHQFFWVAALHETKWKKAYLEYLKDVAVSCDEEAALNRHFTREEREEMRKDAQAFKDHDIRVIAPDR